MHRSFDSHHVLPEQQHRPKSTHPRVGPEKPNGSGCQTRRQHLPGAQWYRRTETFRPCPAQGWRCTTNSGADIQTSEAWNGDPADPVWRSIHPNRRTDVHRETSSAFGVHPTVRHEELEVLSSTHGCWRCQVSSSQPIRLNPSTNYLKLCFPYSLRIYYKNRGDLSKEQKQELSRRCVSMLLYLMRSPFYDKYSKDRIASLLNGIGKNVPLTGTITNLILSYIPHWQETYFYMWST